MTEVERLVHLAHDRFSGMSRNGTDPRILRRRVRQNRHTMLTREGGRLERCEFGEQEVCTDPQELLA
jgi:hypothetical protein